MGDAWAVDPETGDFLLRHYGENGEITGSDVVSPDQFLRGAARDYLRGTALVTRHGDRYEIDPNRRVSEAEFVQSALTPAVDAIVRDSASDEEKIQRLRAAIADIRVIEIMLRNGVTEEMVRRIWPDLDELLQNFTGPGVPSPNPSDRIDGSDSQGVPAPPPPSERTAEPDSEMQGTNSSPQQDPKTGGDPLLLATGQFFHVVTDLELKGRGLNLAFRRTYLHQTIYKGPLGYSWDHCYNLWLREEQQQLPDGTRRNVVHRSTGALREDPYIQILGEPVGDLPPLDEFADAVFEPPPGAFDRLEKHGQTYVFESVGGVRFEYNPRLYIDRIVDPNGNTIRFNYDFETGLLTSVLDPVGKQLLLYYDEMNRLTTLVDVTGKRSVRYAYGDNGDLIEVDLFLEPDFAVSTDYRYLGPDYPPELQHNLTEVIAPTGHSVLENEYGVEPESRNFNRVVRQRSADGEYRYEYALVLEASVDPTADPVNVPLVSTTVAYPNGHIIEHWFNEQGNVVRRAEQVLLFDRIEQLFSEYRYNEDGLLIREVRPDGESVEYRHGREAFAELHGGDVSSASPADRLAFGNLLRRVERPRPGVGEERPIITEYSYKVFGARVASRRGPYYEGNENAAIFYDYDDRANLIRVRFPDGRQPDGIPRPVADREFSYNSYGLLTDASAGPLHVSYVYFDDPLRSGYVREIVRDPEGSAERWFYETDTLGRMTRATAPYGGATDIEWNGFDAPRRLLLPEVAPNARPAFSYSYGRHRLLLRLEEQIVLHDGSAHPDGSLVQTYRYDSYGRLIEHSRGTPAAQTIRTTRAIYDASGLLARHIDSTGYTVAFHHDARGNQIQMTRGPGSSEESTRRLRYNRSGEPVAAIDGRGFVTEITRDGFGRVSSIRDPDGNEVETEYDARGGIVLMRLSGVHPDTDEHVRWSEVEFVYDSAGCLIERRDHVFTPGQDGPETILATQYFYDSLGRPQRIISPTADTSCTYDALGRISSWLDVSGNLTEWTYDDAARTVTVRESQTGAAEDGTLLTQVFQRVMRLDPRGRPSEEIDGLGNTVRRRYDSRGLATWSADAAGQEFLTDYDVFGEPVALRTRRDGIELRAETIYDTAGRVRELVSPVGGRTLSTYDGLGRVATVERGSRRISYWYDAEDNVTRQIDENGITILRGYTPGGLLQTETPDAGNASGLPDAPDYSPVPALPSEYAYTPRGDLAAARNGVATIRLGYDSLNRVLEEHAGTRAVTFAYGDADRRTFLTYPDGRTLAFDYSAAGQLAAVRQTAAGSGYPGDAGAPQERSLVSLWRVGDRPIGIRFGDSHRAALAYDVAKRIIGIEWTRISDLETVFAERALYGSRSECRVQQWGATSRLLEYDPLCQLISARDYPEIPLAALPMEASTQADVDELIRQIEAAAGSAERSFSYRLDENANRLRTEETLSPEAAPAITAYDVDVEDRYRSIGGVALLYDHAGNLISDGVNTYRYDPYNRLAEVGSPSGTVRISYDGLGRMALLETPDQRQEFVWAGPRLIEWRSGGTIQAQVVPLERPHHYGQLATGGAEYSPLFSITGNVLAWLSAEAAQVGRSVYDPFGRVLARTGDWPASFGFCGYWYENLSGLYHLGVRSYHPGFGRFLQRDPAGAADGTNLYAYARHAPGRFTDYWGFESGLSSKWENQERAIGTMTLGVIGIGLGALLLATPVGWFGALAAALAIAAGAAGVGVGAAELATAHTRTREQDLELHRSADTALSIASSPGSLVGATVFAAAGEDPGRGAMVGGLTEAGIGLAGGARTFLRNRGPLTDAGRVNRMLRELAETEIPQRRNIGSSGFSPNAIGAMSEAQVRQIYEDIYGIRYTPELDLPRIPSATGTRNFRRLDLPVIPEREYFGMTFPGELVQVKGGATLGEEDLAQIVDTVREARRRGVVVSLWMRADTRLSWAARKPRIIRWLEEIDAAQKEPGRILFRYDL